MQEIIRKTIEEEQLQRLNMYHENINNAITGNKNYLYSQLKASFKKAKSIDIIVSFLMESGVKLILDDLRNAINRGVKIRILTGNYLNITQPSALYLLKSELQDAIDLRFYNNSKKSFHPKAYIFNGTVDSEIYIGSSNISRGALTSSVEWNYRFNKSSDEVDFNAFFDEFENLFSKHAYAITDEVLRTYSKSWKRSSIQKEIEKTEEIEETENEKVFDIFQPIGAQIEALYGLKNTRKEGFDKGLVVAATGIGKTYLAAFDSKNYKRVLFVAHREEILKQAADSFKNVRHSDDFGFFYSEQKDTNKEVIFALVQTLGKEEYLNEEYFSRDYFSYIVVDEFHHAVSGNYQRIIDYFQPKFLLGLTATPERLDCKDVFALCDYNTIYEVRLKESIDKGWLVPFRYYGIYDETVNYEDLEYKNGKYNDKELEEALMLNKRGNLILNHYLKYNSRRALGFCTSRKHADFMAKTFCEKGIKAVSVYSGEKGEYTAERSEAIKQLRKGDIRVVFSVDMFNEGLDIRSLDMVMFLRPTQSPTIFLQQLGRGLRKDKHKEYLNVLDFIGNYKKANMIPFLLSGQNYSKELANRNTQTDYEFPGDCYVDFDFEIIDIFKRQAEKEMSIKEKILEEFYAIKENLGHVPSRVEFLNNIVDDVYDNIKSKANLNPLSNYMEYLYEKKELNEEEIEVYHCRGKEFIHMIETTSMTKTYKMPLLLAFYNGGNIKMNLLEADIYQSFYEFYHKGSNKVDMLRHSNTSEYESWDVKDYVKLAKNNPINFMQKTHPEFFELIDGYVMNLASDLKAIIENEMFSKHMKDAIDARIMTYYRNRRIN